MSRFITESRSLVKLAAPMALTQFFIMGMGFTDTAMAGHYSATDLAGVALGGNILWPIFMLTTGITMALTPITAQLRGADRVNEIGTLLRQGIWIALVASFVAVVVITQAGTTFQWMAIDREAIAIADQYLDAAAWGIPAAFVYVTLRYTSEGLGHVVSPMGIVAFALVINAFLNYAFIYGRFGAPELGGVGCGYATAIVMWLELLLMVIQLLRPHFRRTGVTTRIDLPNIAIIANIFRIGLPIGLSSFISMAIFSVIGFMVGTLGVVPLAAHSIAGNINWATFVIPMAIGGAASIRVGFKVGAGDYDGARGVGATAMKLALGYALLVSLLLVLFRHDVVTLYSKDTDVLAMAAALILIIAIYQIADATQGAAIGALRGYKDTRAPMIFSLVGYWIIALPFAAYLGFGSYGVYGFWFGMAIGVALVALASGLRLVSTSGNLDRNGRFSGL